MYKNYVWKKQLKRVGAMALTGTLLLGTLAGCGGSGSGGPEAGNASSSDEKSENTADADSGEIQKVRYVMPGNEWSDQDYVLEQVNKKLLEDGMNLEVELIRIPWDAWDQKTNLMLSTGEEFELIQVMQDLKPASVLRSQNGIIPLNDYVDKYPNLKNAMDGFWEDFTVNGEILAVPAASTMNVSKDYGRIYYQQELFDKTGCEIPETIDEVIDVA